MKHVLIHWTATNETSLLTEEFVRDKTMLINPNKEGMVLFGKLGVKPPKGGWKAYLGRVIAASDRYDVVYEKEKKFLSSSSPAVESDIESNAASTARDHKAMNIKRFVSELGSSSDDEVHKTARKSWTLPAAGKNIKQQAERKAYKKTFDNMKTTGVLASDSDTDEEGGNERDNTKIYMAIKELKDEISHLREENITLQKRIPDLLAEALNSSLLGKKLSSATCNFSNSEFGRKRLFSTAVTSNTSTPTSKKPIKFYKTPDNIANQYKAGSDEPKEEEEVEKQASSSNLQLSDLIDSVQMGEVERSVNEKKMTSNLLLAVFGKKILAQSSVTGKSKEGRPALDRVKVEIIIAYVLKYFQKATQYTIKATMAQKCKDERHAIEGRKANAEKR